MRKNNTEFQKKKNVVLFVFGYTCQLCGLIDINNHVHHIDGINGNNSVFNLVPLCGHCHKLTHKLHIKIKVEYSVSLRDQLLHLEQFF